MFFFSLSNPLTHPRKTSRFPIPSIVHSQRKTSNTSKAISQTTSRIQPRMSLFVSALQPYFFYSKEAVRLSMLSAYNAVPGLFIFERPSWLGRMLHQAKVFGTQSLKPDALIAPFRQIALELYEELNTAVAK